MRLLPHVLCAAFVFVCVPAPGAGPGLRFQPAEAGCYAFDTGTLRGRLKLDGKFQGVYPIEEVATGTVLTEPPGALSLYRVLVTNGRFGHAARDWPTTSQLLPDGSVEARWPAAPEHPLEITAVYRLLAPDTMDLLLSVRPEQAMPQFELFVSSYFTPGFRALVYRRPADGAAGEPALVDVATPTDPRLKYVMFPRDEQAAALVGDGRWKLGSNPVDWSIERGLAGPLIVRRDEKLGIAAALMCPAADCFAVSCPWNQAAADVRGHRSLYSSLFGRDLPAGQWAAARCRLVIGRGLSDRQAVERYQALDRTAREPLTSGLRGPN